MLKYGREYQGRRPLVLPNFSLILTESTQVLLVVAFSHKFTYTYHFGPGVKVLQMYSHRLHPFLCVVDACHQFAKEGRGNRAVSEGAAIMFEIVGQK